MFTLHALHARGRRFDPVTCRTDPLRNELEALASGADRHEWCQNRGGSVVSTQRSIYFAKLGKGCNRAIDQSEIGLPKLGVKFEGSYQIGREEPAMLDALEASRILCSSRRLSK